MLKLEDREWKEFKIGDIFEVSGTTTTKPTDLIKDGLIPRITCSSIDNGFDNTYQNIATENGGVLTVDSATIGSVLYQAADFIATDHVEKIYFKDKFINKYVGKFLVSAITNSIGNKYNYGYKFSQFRIKRQTILLPTTSNGEPDYEFMEEYIKEREEQKLEEYVSFARKEIEKIEKKNC